MDYKSTIGDKMRKILILSLVLLIPLTLFSKNTKKKVEFKCGQKKYCKQMTSCKEAYFYLKKCGIKRLDRDKDGIPCEKICGH